MAPRSEFARRVARKYLRAHRAESPPVPVEYILVVERIHVHAVEYPDDTAGESWWEDEAAHIAVNRALPTGRLRFTLAHEFGHLALRHHRQRFQEAPLTSVRPAETLPAALDPIEIEANAFAAELLLPLGWLARDWARRADIRWIATRYEVSLEAVRQALRRLDR